MPPAHRYGGADLYLEFEKKVSSATPPVHVIAERDAFQRHEEEEEARLWQMRMRQSMLLERQLMLQLCCVVFWRRSRAP